MRQRFKKNYTRYTQYKSFRNALSYCLIVSQEGGKKSIERRLSTAYPPLIHPMGVAKDSVLQVVKGAIKCVLRVQEL